jgi:hypothetical protein
METVYITKSIMGTFYYKDKERQIPHRIDGPAKEWFTGVKAYYLNGDWIRNEKEYNIQKELYKETR